jgi:hypothetical protein
MKNQKQSAVDLLRDRLMKEFGFGYSDNIHEELKAIEKEQIIDAYRDGRSDQHSKERIFYNRNAIHYYTSTYGK